MRNWILAAVVTDVLTKNVPQGKGGRKSYQAVMSSTENPKLSIETAVPLGQNLMKAGITSHVTQYHFWVAYYFHRFEEDVDSSYSILNVSDFVRFEHDLLLWYHKSFLSKLPFLSEEYHMRFTASKRESRLITGTFPEWIWQSPYGVVCPSLNHDATTVTETLPTGRLDDIDN
eukprot:IDg22124t1